MGEDAAAQRDWPHYTGALTSIKSFFRLADGVRTVFLVGDATAGSSTSSTSSAGPSQSSHGQVLAVPCARALHRATPARRWAAGTSAWC